LILKGWQQYVVYELVPDVSHIARVCQDTGGGTDKPVTEPNQIHHLFFTLFVTLHGGSKRPIELDH